MTIPGGPTPPPDTDPRLVGEVDIFFPTSFPRLRRIHGGGRIVRSSRFLQKHAEGGGKAARTRSGYNPLLEDFANTCFLLSSGRERGVD